MRTGQAWQAGVMFDLLLLILAAWGLTLVGGFLAGLLTGLLIGYLWR